MSLFEVNYNGFNLQLICLQRELNLDDEELMREAERFEMERMQALISQFESQKDKKQDTDPENAQYN